MTNVATMAWKMFGWAKREVSKQWHNVLGLIFNMPVRNRIKKVRYVHLMFNDKFNSPFVSFLNKHFDKSQHLILCKRLFSDYAFPVAENVMEVKTFRHIGVGDNVRCVICHSLFDQELVDILYDDGKLLRKAAWMIWGGDLYSAKRSVKDDYVRRHFAFVITDTDGDDVEYRNRYSQEKKSIRAGYTFPVTWEMVLACSGSKYRHDDCVCVQINNSCDKSTLEMIDTLSAFSKNNIKVRTILSYGELKYREEIIKKGKEKFGDKFVYQVALMSPSQYSEWMSNVDVLVLNHNRQQGIGNSFLALALGAKLYIRSTVTTYKHFLSRGIMCYDSLKIAGMSFQTFVMKDKDEVEKNKRLVKQFFDNEELARLWKPVFD